MASEGLPPFDLDSVQIRDAAAQKVAAIPLEPSSLVWILCGGKDRIAAGHGTMTIRNPSIFFPFLERETGIHTELVDGGVMSLG
jgi:hypothetical protein